MHTAYIQANTDGRLHSALEPSLSPLNRGFLYGDSIYEVWRTFDGILFAFDEHWQRLERSASALHLPLPLDQTVLLNEIRRTVRAYFVSGADRSELYVRLQVSRGGGPIGLDPALADRSNYVILVQALKDIPLEKLRKGIRLSVATQLHRNHRETLDPAWKTGNYLNNILCLREAVARDADDVVMTNLSGEITESAVSNIFFVRDRVLHTPRVSAGLLEGITRASIIGSVAERVGLAVNEAPIRVEDLGTFQECFIASTTKGILAVSAIDQFEYKTGAKTGTARLEAAFAEYVREEIARCADQGVIEPTVQNPG